MIANYRVAISQDYRNVESAEGYSSISMTDDWLRSGNWQCSWPRNHVGAKRLVAAAVAKQDISRYGIHTLTGSTSVYGGHITHLALVDGQAQGYAKDTIVASGVSDNYVLAGRVGFPNPAEDVDTVNLDQWAAYADARVLPAGDLALALIRDNIGSTALITRRRFAALAVPAATTGIGLSYKYNRRFPDLLTAARDLAVGGKFNLGVRRVPGGLTVVIEPEEINPTVRWSRSLGTLEGAVLTWTAAKVTSAVMGGAGEGVARVFIRREPEVPPGGWGPPREVFFDATGDDTAEELKVSADEEIEKGQQARSITTSPVENLAFAYGLDFRSGQMMRVDIAGGAPVVARLESLTLSRNGNAGWRTKPQMGPAVGSVRDVQRRWLRDLQRRQRD